MSYSRTRTDALDEPVSHAAIRPGGRPARDVGRRANGDRDARQTAGVFADLAPFIGLAAVGLLVLGALAMIAAIRGL
jgi:hypothetical protein